MQGPLSHLRGQLSPRESQGGVRILAQEMERICTDTLHSLFYDCPSKRRDDFLFKNFFVRENKSSGCFTLEKIRDTIHFTIQIVEGESL